MGAECTGNRAVALHSFLGYGVTGGESFSVNFGALYPRELRAG